MPKSTDGSNRKSLSRLMSERDISISTVAAILNRKKATVYAWVSVSGVDIPDHSLELLEIKTREVNK